MYMRRCIDLARIARGQTFPNPLVGAVLVYKDRIIGEGFHHRAGEPHAEVLAFASVRAADRHLIPQSILYVSLEPCAHRGRTPACAPMVVDQGVAGVVVGSVDPFFKVHGKGIQILREAGIPVEVGVLKEETDALNRFFITAHTLGRPYVTLKWARSADGFIDAVRSDPPQTPPVHFSTPLSCQWVHNLRGEHQAILVGNGTVLFDNPRLSNRATPHGPQPLRIILCGREAIPPHYHVLDDTQPTLLLIPEGAKAPNVQGMRQTERMPLPAGATLKEILQLLYRRGIIALLVEGGAKLLKEFIANELYDCIRVERSPLRLRQGVAAPALPPGLKHVGTLQG